MSLLHGAAAQTPSSQVSTGWMMEVLAVVEKILIALKMFRHFERSGFARALVKVSWHCWDRLSSDEGFVN